MVFLTACTADAPPAATWKTKLGAWLEKRDVTVSPSPSASPADDPSQSARNSKENAELLAEIHAVVFLREAKDRSTFGSYVDTLNQGATLEGVYNGFTHSVAYRQLETAKIPFRTEGLVYFAEELAQVPRVLGKDQIYTVFHTLPLPRMNPQEEQFERSYWGQPTLRAKSDIPVVSDTSAIRRFFAKSSLFTLKRVLGDEMQKIVAAKSVNRDELIQWYAGFCADRCDLGVDFGLPQRNQCDREFHAQWATRATNDRILWEVLNRSHRLMNAFYALPEASKTGEVPGAQAKEKKQ